MHLLSDSGKNTIMVKNMSIGAAEGKGPKSTNCRAQKYKGVRMRSWGSWVSEIRAPNQKTRIWLGSYSTPEAAARAYDAALFCLKGSSANLNFPITSTTHIPNALLSPRSIQRVAAAAAANCPASPPPPPLNDSPSSPDEHKISLSASPCCSSSFTFPSLSPSPSCSQNCYPLEETQELSCMFDQWIEYGCLQSPKLVDQILHAYTTPSAMEDCDEEGDIRLWNFC